MLIIVSCSTLTFNSETTSLSWKVIVAIIAGIYEVIARCIPTVKNWSILGKVIEVLLWISERFNRKKK